MVDISRKDSTHRVAIATGQIVMQPQTLALIQAGTHKKGDVLGIARVAAIMGCKKTAELVPLCHPLALTHVSVDFSLDETLPGVVCQARCETHSSTGVEMEALTAVQVALLTLYDMCKAVDRQMRMDNIRLLHKSGGRSGVFVADASCVRSFLSDTSKVSPPMLPYALYTAEQVRELDRLALQTLAIDGYTLMYKAGQAAFATLRTHWPKARRLSILCGPGNNGGDGYVLARLALAVGFEVRVLEWGQPERLPESASQARKAWHEAGGKAHDDLHTALAGADLVVDALLGTGLQRPVSGPLAHWIEAINQSPCPVFALDVPSGLDADQGAVLGHAVKANLTLSFIALKPGLFTAEGQAHSGTVLWDGLGAPPEIYTALPPYAQRLDRQRLADFLTPRVASAHKGHFGHVLAIGGAPGMSGAVRLCAEAAARAGAGLVSVATHPDHAALIAQARPELMSHGIVRSAELAPLLKRATVIAIGPGLGQDRWSRMLWEQALASHLPMVVDADALNLLAQQPIRRDSWILTPHPGEAARLLGETDARAVQAARFTAAEHIAAHYGGVCVLKGSGTLITDGPQRWLCSAGNPGMASGGMGDVLTGLIAGLLAQGNRLTSSACAGVCLHASAADQAAAEGMQGLLASDVLVQVRSVLNSVVTSDTREAPGFSRGEDVK